MSRIVSAWRTPVPPLVRVVAIAAAIASGLLIIPRLDAGLSSVMTSLLAFVVGASAVVVVLLAWQLIERRKR